MSSATNAANTMQWGYQKLAWYANGFRTELYATNPTQVNILNLPNKGGILAITNDFVTTAAGTAAIPPMIIPNGTGVSGGLNTTPQNGAIERDSNGQLWETHGGVRSRLITTTDGLILVAYKCLNSIQTNLDTAISSTTQYNSSSSLLGKIANVSVQKLNSATQIVSSAWDSNPAKPTVAKVEVFLKINNGLFATHYSGSSAVNQVKIMEYVGLNNFGYKNYQSLLLFNIQNSDPLLAQWSTVDFALQTVTDGALVNTDKSYYLRDATNSRTFGAAEASFSFVFVNTLTFADATNTGGLNSRTLLRANNYALYIETIR